MRLASAPVATTLPSSSWPMTRVLVWSRSSERKIMSLNALRNQMPRSDPQNPVMIGRTMTQARSW